MSSFHTEKCSHLVSEHETSARCLCSSIHQFLPQVTTHLENLENLEKSGNSKVVREKSENGKKSEEAKSVEIAVKILVSLHMHYILFHLGVI